jgi:hypothetical protein
MKNKQVSLGAFTIGADPEMFLFNTKTDNYIAVQPFVKGTKKRPQPLPQGGNVQRDNVAIEFGVKPAKNKLSFIQNIGDTLMDVLDILPEGIGVDITPSADFPESELEHDECKMFGCDPDMNAWTMQVNEPPPDAGTNTFRSCGGHIHVGYLAGSGNDFLNDIDGKAMLIRVMDCLHGTIATILDNNDAAIARRKLYGKAGCMRTTPYGVEYRTLSNFWIKHPKLVELMWSLTKDALDIMRKQEFMKVLGMLNGHEVISIIEDGLAEEAQKKLEILVTEEFISADTLCLLEECRPLMKDNNFKEAWEEIA